MLELKLIHVSKKGPALYNLYSASEVAQKNIMPIVK